MALSWSSFFSSDVNDSSAFPHSLALRKMEEETAMTEDKIDVLLSLLPCGSISEICSAHLAAAERTEIKERVALLQQITEDLGADSPLF